MPISIQNGAEATRIDYKLSLEKEKPKSWLKSVSAFANTSGGHIYFGYTDDTHIAQGLDDVQARVPSMRRNEIISDIFGRLHYMDRRGSGIGRIINSYTDFAEKPIFYSNEFYFQVVLPNRSVANPAQMNLDQYTQTQLSDEKTQLTGEKTQLAERKLNSDKDWELIYFKEKLLKCVGNAFRHKTIDQIEQLFNRYRYDYSFNRRNIAEMFDISENGASGFIKKCLEKNIIKKEKIDSYRFINKQAE